MKNALYHDSTFHAGNISLYHGDCMDVLKQIPDQFFDLAIVLEKPDESISVIMEPFHGWSIHT